MKFQELDLTKKIRRINWVNKNEYIFYDEEDQEFLDQFGGTYKINPETMFDDRWEYFEEPKPKKRYWLWDVKNGKDVFKTSIYYDDSGYSPSRTMSIEKDLLIRKLENEFIEV